MIYVSTSAFRHITTLQTARLLHSYGIKNIEISGGKYENFNIKNYNKICSDCNIILHNYFPQPKIPFVFNLASKNKKIIEKSMSLAKYAIRLSSNLRNKTYSFHAGFLFDPSINQLGKSISKIKLNNINQCIEIFLTNVINLSNYAKKYNVNLLIENNVISKKNIVNFQSNPFLMTNIESCYQIMKNTPSNVNLLIDIGHLKVSSKSEKFSTTNFFKKLNKWIKGYHISDNNGLSDSNNKITKKTSLLQNLKKNKKIYVLEINEINCKNIENQLNIIKNFLTQQT